MAILTTEPDGWTVKQVSIPHAAGGKMPKTGSGDLYRTIETVMRETAKGRPAVEIAARRGWDVSLVEQIARLYVTHPGVDADAIMAKMGV